MDPKSAAFLAMGIALGLGTLGPGLGMGTAVAAAIESTVRQPEMAGKVQTLMFIGLAFIEALALYALVVAFMLYGVATAVPATPAA